jgi:hypothetical protein
LRFEGSTIFADKGCASEKNKSVPKEKKTGSRHYGEGFSEQASDPDSEYYQQVYQFPPVSGGTEHKHTETRLSLLSYEIYRTEKGKYGISPQCNGI